MNFLFLLNLIKDLLKNEKPTVEEINCVRIIVENMIKVFEPLQKIQPVSIDLINKDLTVGSADNDLTVEAQQAKSELI